MNSFMVILVTNPVFESYNQCRHYLHKKIKKKIIICETKKKHA